MLLCMALQGMRGGSACTYTCPLHRAGPGQEVLGVCSVACHECTALALYVMKRLRNIF